MKDLNQPARGFDDVIHRMNAVKKARGLSNKQIGEKSGCSENTVRNLLKGNPVNSWVFIDVIVALGLEIQVI